MSINDNTRSQRIQMIQRAQADGLTLENKKKSVSSKKKGRKRKTTDM